LVVSATRPPAKRQLHQLPRGSRSVDVPSLVRLSGRAAARRRTEPRSRGAGTQRPDRAVQNAASQGSDQVTEPAGSWWDSTKPASAPCLPIPHQDIPDLRHGFSPLPTPPSGAVPEHVRRVVPPTGMPSWRNHHLWRHGQTAASTHRRTPSSVRLGLSNAGSMWAANVQTLCRTLLGRPLRSVGRLRTGSLLHTLFASRARWAASTGAIKAGPPDRIVGGSGAGQEADRRAR